MKYPFVFMMQLLAYLNSMSMLTVLSLYTIYNNKNTTGIVIVLFDFFINSRKTKVFVGVLKSTIATTSTDDVFKGASQTVLSCRSKLEERRKKNAHQSQKIIFIHG